MRRSPFRIVMTAVISLTLVAGLMLPLQAENSYAAGNEPSFSASPNIKSKITTLKKDKKQLNLRLAANQAIGRHDTLQGSCYGNGHIYYLLYDQGRDKCKVVKMRMSDLSVVKVSPALKLYHGNDMTFNTRTNRIVVAHAKPDRKRISIINPTTLGIERTLSIDDLPEDLPGIDWDRIKEKGGYIGFNNIAYNEKYDQYVVQLYTMRDFLFLDAAFKPIRYVKPSDWDRQIYQGMDSFGDCIVVCNSPKSGKPDNVLSVYDWNGKYLSRVYLSRNMELESVFHYGNRLYVGYYSAYWAGYKWINKTKKVKKKVKVKVRVKIKSGKNKGKYKYVTKTKKKKVTVRYYAKQRKLGKRFLNRDGYLYRVTNL